MIVSLGETSFDNVMLFFTSELQKSLEDILVS